MSKSIFSLIWRQSKKFFYRAVNTIFFYAGWLICVESAARGNGVVGPLFILACIIIHFIKVPNRKHELKLIALMALLGTIIDSIYASIGMIHYNAGYEGLPWLAPFWITAIWALYASTLNHSLTWLRHNWWIAAIFGAVGGPASYAASIELGAASYGFDKAIVLAILTIVWTFAFPLSFVVSNWLDRKIA